MKRYAPSLVIAAAVAFTPLCAHAGWLTTLLDLDPEQGQLPESVTTDPNGNLYMTMGSSVTTYTPGGQLTTIAALPVPAGVLANGVKYGPDDHLYIATGSLAPEPPTSFIWRVSLEGDVEEFAALDPEGFPNDLIFADDGLMYVTDPLIGQIWTVDSGGNPSVWIADELLTGNEEDPFLILSHFGVDGIALDKYEDYVYVSNLDYGQILRVPIEPDGSAGGFEVYVDDFDLLAGADGIAFDKNGSLYVAVNGQDRLAVVGPGGGCAYVFAEGPPLDAPSSVVFGETWQDRKTLYIASFAITRAFGIFPGEPDPKLHKLSLWTPGLSLF